ncbi:FtsX-like permease family protein [Limibacter armeniacum]|uniref:ABC transporter permease n=1 Tax=Limibacter armeniacum TaxID=466084 RepID=UPI002FE5E3AB
MNKHIIILAWRNIWRSKRRTIITAMSIFFAVLMAVLMRSMQLGSYDLMIDNAVHFYSGYMQVHDSGYWENKSINRLLEDTPALRNKIQSAEGVESLFPRLETYALTASIDKTRGAMVMGIAADAENAFSNLKEKVSKGQYLTDSSKGVMISKGLSDYLELGLQDTIVLIGQGYHGVNAAAKYPISGIISHPNPQMDKGLIYMPISLAQQFVGAPNMATSYVLNIHDRGEISKIRQELSASLGGEFEVMSWDDMQPELVQMIESDSSGGIIMLFILYTVIAFGIFGTIMMMTLERKREFGVLVAVGMYKTSLGILVALESLLIGFLGLVAGFLFSLPLLWYLHNHPIPLSGDTAEAMLKMGVEPILPFSMDNGIFLMQAIIVIAIMLLCLAYPLFKITLIKPADAVRL